MVERFGNLVKHYTKQNVSITEKSTIFGEQKLWKLAIIPAYYFIVLLEIYNNNKPNNYTNEK